MVVCVDAADDDVGDEYGSVGEGGEYADEEVGVVALAHAVVKPHTVMVELIDAAVAGAAVLAVGVAVAVAKLAV